MIETVIPSPGESITEVSIGTWHKATGDFVEKDEVICEVESDKATLPVTAAEAGTLEILIEEGEDAIVGDVLCKIDTSAQSSATHQAQPSATTSSEPSQTTSGQEQPIASPAAQKIMVETGASVEKGTGKDGRITKQDVLQASSVKSSEPTQEHVSKTSPPSTDISAKRQKMSRMRQAISARLVKVKNETAMLTTFNEVDMSTVMALRNRYQETFQKTHDVKLGFMSFFTKACAMALQKFPMVNAMIDGNEFVLSDAAHIGIAVSTPKGLVVPVVRNSDQMNLADIEKEILRLALKARENQISIDDMQGGTFSITNGGVFGSMLSTPILNSPQSSILGMHNIVERPIAVAGQVAIRPIMYLALSYDHRVIDGRESVSFLKAVKESIEDPARMLLGV